METTVDIFASKGIEYLFVIGYLLLFIPFWLYLSGRRRVTERSHLRVRAPSWVTIPDGYFFHPAHTWAHRARGTEVRVGLDALATGLVGLADTVILPSLGEEVEAGRVAAVLEVDGARFELLAPLDGEVTAINQAVAARPATMVEDPYGMGWLFDLRMRDGRDPARSLLSDSEARAWMGEAELAVMEAVAPGVGPTLQDGGQLLPGSLRSLAPAKWTQLVERILGTSDKSAI